MPITIGQKLDSDFRNPLGLLSDCHRRIQFFLLWLNTISEERHGKRLQGESLRQFDVALRYFREAAPKHTLDEEESLFPRLRAHERPETVAAFALLDKLHTDHEDAEIRHRQVDELGCKWLSEGSLSSGEADLLISLLQDLTLTYDKHISLEENELFPLAGNTLNRSELEAIAREMAARRGLGTVGGVSS
ncbi:MAG TPA: hemerythrin domain-containing protein [Pyrinomonadaceae bacterium]|nr:hemerythrin domain-containing protein [Pyrinomonadaceae bacterium]